MNSWCGNGARQMAWTRQTLEAARRCFMQNEELCHRLGMPITVYGALSSGWPLTYPQLTSGWNRKTVAHSRGTLLCSVLKVKSVILTTKLRELAWWAATAEQLQMAQSLRACATGWALTWASNLAPNLRAILSDQGHVLAVFKRGTRAAACKGSWRLAKLQTCKAKEKWTLWASSGATGSAQMCVVWIVCLLGTLSYL